jgi:hypothetical protein
MTFECDQCHNTFEKDGLQVILHEKTVGRVCPACLANANTITVTIARPRPGKDFNIYHVEAAEQSESLPFYPVKGGGDGHQD